MPFFLAETDLPWANGILSLAQMGGAVALVWYYNAVRDPRIQASFDQERNTWREQALKREDRYEQLLIRAIECITTHNQTLARCLDMLQEIKDKK